MQGHTKSKVIERTVTQYFRDNALAAFDGHIHTDDVIGIVRHTLSWHFKARLTAYNIGEVYDAIRLMGPCGENQHAWLKMWSRECQSDLVA